MCEIDGPNGPSGARSHCHVPSGPGRGGSVIAVAKRASDMPIGPEIVTTNPDEDCSPAAFRRMLDELLAGPEPELVSIGAAEALRELRVDTGA